MNSVWELYRLKTFTKKRDGSEIARMFMYQVFIQKECFPASEIMIFSFPDFEH